jgi:hypothetical protein
MLYKRISKGFAQYALFPNDVNIDQIIEKYGSDHDYYDSIYLYEQKHYDEFITAVQEGCEFLNIKFDDNLLIETVSRVMYRLKRKREEELSKSKKRKIESILSRLSVSGIDDTKTKRIVFDVDNEAHIEDAREDAETIAIRLIDKGVPKDQVQVYFSGKKGFSVELLTTSYFTKDEFINIVYHIASDLNTFDERVKDHQRLFRVPMTKHHETKLHKIPLTLDDLSNKRIEIIKEEAQNETDEHYDILNKWKEIELPKAVLDLANKPHFLVDPSNSKLDEIDDDEIPELDMSHKPKWLPETKYALQQGYFYKGERNTALIILASTYKNNGFDENHVYALLKEVIKKQQIIETKHKGVEVELYSKSALQKEVINFVFGPTWRGGMYTEQTNELLQKVAKRLNLKFENEKGDNILSMKQIKESWKHFATHLKQNTIKTGLDIIDNKIRITTGMMVGLLAAASGGKTTWSLNFIENVSKNNLKVLYYSLDMAERLIYTRCLQRHTGLIDPAEDYELNKNCKIIEQGMDKIDVLYENVDIIARAVTVDEIEEQVIKSQQLYGDEFKLLVVDYLEKVRGPYSDSMANDALVSQRLSDIAKDYNIAVFLLLQPQKSAGDPSQPLLSYRQIKGSSTLENNCRTIMSMWRPGFNPKDMSKDKYASIAILKNNMGNLGQFDFNWDGVRGLFLPMDEHDKIELEELLEKNQKEKIIRNF